MKEIVKKGYNEGNYSDVFRNTSNLNHTQQYFFQKLSSLLKSNSYIVDLGCGTGIPFDRYLINQGFNVTGYDVSSKHIAMAKQNVPDANFIEADMTTLNNYEGTIDAFIAMYSIFHLPKEQHYNLFKNIHFSLRNKGLFLANFGTKQTQNKVSTSFCGSEMQWSNYTPSIYEELMCNVGFEILDRRFESGVGDTENHFWILSQKKEGGKVMPKNRKVVYTSFDGDDMIHIDDMSQLAIKNGYISLNPEHALGYYLSTTALNNQKREVMKDCLSLVMMCDDFWVFNRNKSNEIKGLSEGIVAEMILWSQKKNSNFRFLNLTQLKEKLHNFSCTEEDLSITEAQIRESIPKETFDELSSFLSEGYPNLRPVVLIDIPNKDFKYADWARKRAFHIGKVPLVPQHIISPRIYMAYNMPEQYNRDVLTLSDKTSGIWAVYSSKKELEILEEKYNNRENVEFVSTKELQIPKYFHPRTWCLTKKEATEIENMGGPN